MPAVSGSGSSIRATRCTAHSPRKNSGPTPSSTNRPSGVRLLPGSAVLLLLAAGLTSCGITANLPPPPPNLAAQNSDERADALLAKMTQAEKLQLVHGNLEIDSPRTGSTHVPGIPRLGIPSLYFADGSVGISDLVGLATALPSSLANAASWDVSEAYKYGDVIGTEAADYGENVNLGGNINLTGREPRDGRTSETKGEDPILAGKIAAAQLTAIQAHHVIADIKHFAFNDQETGRSTANSIIDERGGRESDLLAFEIGIKDSNTQSVMCSYNLTNGRYDCENPHLLDDVLKTDWQFRGWVLSDFGATHSTGPSADFGLDQEDPNGPYFSSLQAYIDAGLVPESRLNDMVHRILRAMFEVGLFDYPQQVQRIPIAADAAVAQEIEEQGAVLLKNSAGELPLQAANLQSIAVIGLHADAAVLSGGGSSQVLPFEGSIREDLQCPPLCGFREYWDLSSPLQAIRSMAPSANVRFTDGANAAAAAQLAASSQVAIVFVSQYASEAMDEPSLNLTDFVNSPPVDQDSLVSAVAAANPNTVVVIENGGPIVMPWLGQAAAVLETWYPGESGGPAIANLLFGVVNPSGKLPITFPANVSQLPRPQIAQPPDQTTPFPVNYFEGFNVGYKWYDAKGLEPLFHFGYGLSYTTFAITNPVLTNNLASSANPNLQVAFELTNTGKAAGAEVDQVYLGLPAALGEPPRRLVGWQKTMLAPGVTTPVVIEVDENDSSHPLSYWDTGSKSWTVAPGNYTVYVGNSSNIADLKVVATFTVGQ